MTIALLLIVGMGAALRSGQASGRNALRDRFGDRARTSSQFVSTYVGQLFARERDLATANLSGAHPTAAFDAAVPAFGFRAAVLLDSHGRALALFPTAPEKVGTQVASKYAHLRAALSGRPAVSAVVPSAVQQIPVVAFAVPFETRTGRRVFSGAYAVDDTPLGAFLDNALTIAGSHVYLVDSSGIVAASNGAQSSTPQSLRQRDANLAGAVTHQASGYVGGGARRYYFSKQQVAGTPWSLYLEVPAGPWFAPVDGPAQTAAWFILGGLSILVLAAAWMASRLVEGRWQLRSTNALLTKANHDLEQVARSDELTGLFNRRHINEHLLRLLAGARRHDFPISVLMIDIDHFKRLNDTFGHQAGDVALRHVARVLSAGVRAEDILGRWGGEEFLAILPAADLTQAVAIADRLLRAVATEPVELGTGGDLITITISVGVAEYAGGHPDVLLHRADIALYQAKASGRNTVTATGNVTPTRHAD